MWLSSCNSCMRHSNFLLCCADRLPASVFVVSLQRILSSAYKMLCQRVYVYLAPSVLEYKTSRVRVCYSVCLRCVFLLSSCFCLCRPLRVLWLTWLVAVAHVFFARECAVVLRAANAIPAYISMPERQPSCLASL